jgi:hypothetical protein
MSAPWLIPGPGRPVPRFIRCCASATLAPPVSKVPMAPRGVEAGTAPMPVAVKRVFPWTRSSSCETPVSPTGVSAVSATLAGHRHIGVAAPATETKRSRASQEPSLLLGIIESRPPRSHIRRSQGALERSILGILVHRRRVYPFRRLIRLLRRRRRFFCLW